MYRIDTFKELGFYDEKTEAQSCDFEEGRIIRNPNVPERIKRLMREVGGNSYGGDFSRQDSAVITSFLTAGYQPADVYVTFSASPRGQDALSRKNGHGEDYLRRTIEAAVGFLSKEKRVNGNISIDFSRKKDRSTQTGIVVSMANEIEVEHIRWLWPSYIPAGKLTIIAGDPGMGKSTIVADLVSRISRGTNLPTGKRGVTGTSLIASAEDSPEDTIVPRLIAAEADLKRVGIIREVRDEVLEDDTRFLSLPRDLSVLRDTLKSTGARIMVIDPLNAFLEKDTDTYKDQDMRRVLHPMEEIAHETGTAIIVVAHLTKKEDVSTLYRIGGSIGFIGAARSVLCVTKTEDNTRVLFSLKCNIAKNPAALTYETKDVRKKKKDKDDWVGEDIVHSSGIRWLGEIEFNPSSKSSGNQKADNESVNFLKEVLLDAEQIQTEVIYREARTAGIGKADLNKAKNQLGVKSVKKDGNWYWKWPEE